MPNTVETPHYSYVLHLDILELILFEIRNDRAALAACARASQSLLPIARKFIYRTVSLDYCENPYGYEEQRRLRASLSANQHLCSYVRAVRLSLPAPANRCDPVLVAILEGLVRLESVHVLGMGLQAEFVSDESTFASLAHHGYQEADAIRSHPRSCSTGANSHQLGPSQVVKMSSSGLGDGSRSVTVEDALKRVFGLKSLRKVVLENIYPLEDWHLGLFEDVKHLELISVGGGPPSEKGLTSTLDSTVTGLDFMESQTSTSTATRGGAQPATEALTSNEVVPERDGSSGLLFGSSLAPQPPKHRHYTSSSPNSPSWSSASSTSAGDGFADTTNQSYSDLASLCLAEDGHRSQAQAPRDWRGNGKPSKMVRLEHLVVNVERVRPILDVISGTGRRGDGNERTRVAGQSCLDFSALKQAHIYVWDPDDTRGMWEILHQARRSLERLTLRYLQNGEEHRLCHAAFDNLHSVVLGTQSFNSMLDDPLRPLILFLKGGAEKFPALRNVKISFDLWGCESSGIRWEGVTRYRGWRELDEALALLDSGSGCKSESGNGWGGSWQNSKTSQLETIVFEVWCSAGYKTMWGSHEQLTQNVRQTLLSALRVLRGGESQEGTNTSPGEGTSLLMMIRNELPYLGHQRHFTLV